MSKEILFDIGIGGPLAGIRDVDSAADRGFSLSKVIPGIATRRTDFRHAADRALVRMDVFSPRTPPDIYLIRSARAAWVGIAGDGAELLPIGQLDGGHVLYAFLGEKTRCLSRIFVGMLADSMGILLRLIAWLFWAVFLFFFGLRHPAIIDPAPVRRTRRWLAICGAHHSDSVVHSRPDPHSGLVKISATIITYNEERNLPRAIESLRCADEIVVIDSGSSDRTVEIAEKLGARVVESPWPGYAKQKNFAAEQASTIGFCRSTPTNRSARRWKARSGR